jgi:hypothetical protein
MSIITNIMLAKKNLPSGPRDTDALTCCALGGVWPASVRSAGSAGPSFALAAGAGDRLRATAAIG